MIVKRVKIGDQSWELQKSASISYETFIQIYYTCKNNVIVTFENFVKSNEKS